MKHTTRYNDGYRYYVYVGPGNISYFQELAKAQEYAKKTDGAIGEVNQ